MAEKRFAARLAARVGAGVFAGALNGAGPDRLHSNDPIIVRFY